MLTSMSIHLDCKPIVKCDDVVPTQTTTRSIELISQKSIKISQEGNLARYLNIEIMQIACKNMQFCRRLLGYCISAKPL